MRMLAVAVALCTLLAPHARALTVNPLDSALPLDQHARTLCQSEVGSGATHDTCSGGTRVEGTALPLQSVLGTGAATADLATGQLRATATSQALNDGDNLIRSGGFGQAELWDMITIHNIPAGGSVAVDLVMTVDGSFFTTDLVNPNTQAAEVVGLVRGFTEGAVTTQFGATGITIRQGNDGRVAVTSLGNVGSADTTSNAQGAQQLFADPADIVFVSTLHFVATSSAPSFSFMARLQTMSGLGYADESPDVKNARTDFGSTAQFALVASQGVTFTSGSEVFLSSVPEPGLTALVAMTAAALAWRRRATHSRGAGVM